MSVSETNAFPMENRLANKAMSRGQDMQINRHLHIHMCANSKSHCCHFWIKYHFPIRSESNTNVLQVPINRN